jgi:hypothetical protein
MLSQNEKLLQSLRVELKVYEKLDEEHRKHHLGTRHLGPGFLRSGQTVGSRSLRAEL